MFDAFKGSITLCIPLKLVSFLQLQLQSRDEIGPAKDEFPEVISKTPELLQFSSVFGDRPVLHNSNLCRVHSQPLCANDVAKEVQLRLDKLAFSQVSIQLMLSEQ